MGRGRRRRRQSRRRNARQQRLLVVCDNQENLSRLEKALQRPGIRVEGAIYDAHENCFKSSTYDGAVFYGQLPSEYRDTVKEINAPVWVECVTTPEGRVRNNSERDGNTGSMSLLHIIESSLQNANLTVAESPGSARLKELQSAVAAHPADVAIRQLFARELIDRQEYDEAIKALQKGIESNPQDTSLRLSLGHAYFQAGKPDDAYNALQNLEGMQPALLRGEVQLVRARKGDTSTLDEVINGLEQSLSQANNLFEGDASRGQLILLELYCHSQSKDHLASAATLVEALRDVTEESPFGQGPLDSNTAGLALDLRRASKTYRTLPADTRFTARQSDGRSSALQLQIKFLPSAREAKTELSNYRALWDSRDQLKPLVHRDGCKGMRLELPRWMCRLPNNALVWPSIPWKRVYTALENMQGREKHLADGRIRILQRIVDYNAVLEHYGTKALPGLPHVRDYAERRVIDGKSLKLGFYADRHLQALDRISKAGIELEDPQKRHYIDIVRQLVETPLVKDPLDMNFVWFTDPQADNWCAQSHTHNDQTFLQLGRIDFGTYEIRHALDNSAMITAHELAGLNRHQSRYLHVRAAAQRLAFHHLDLADRLEQEGRMGEATTEREKATDLISRLPKDYDAYKMSGLDTRFKELYEAAGADPRHFLEAQIPAAEFDRHMRILGMQVNRLWYLTQSVEELSGTNRSGLVRLAVHSQFDGDGPFQDPKEQLQYRKLQARTEGISKLRQQIYARLNEVKKVAHTLDSAYGTTGDSSLSGFLSTNGLVKGSSYERLFSREY